ncbi:DUF1289 domain-containing protein [Chthonobacter rhizosphaerae]|uniref:DUF1289 domain-containing protein n=1 Tax=Chthonobacter rhizosphaerae TaxID=2735553 RepID=UPI003CCDA753
MTVSTPCIKICAIDPARGLCVGCLRTLDEIGAWGRMSEPERLAVIAALPARGGRMPRGARTEA